MSTSTNFAADVSNPQLGQQIHGPFVIRKIDEKEARNGKKYWNVELCNETGTITCRVWQEKFEMWEGVQPGSPVMITGRIENGFPEGTLELSVQRIQLLPAPHPVQQYLNPVYPGDMEALKAEFEKMRNAIEHPGYRLFFDRFFETVCPKERFFTCPAARTHHHAYIGGLLEHSLEVTKLWLAFAEHEAIRDLVSKDLGIVGSMIHDAGKIHEYVWEGVAIDLSPDSLLYGHITSGVLMIQKVMTKYREELRAAGFTEQDAKYLIHMVVSHHGKADWGSPTPPAMIESVLLHHADNMSAKVRGIANIVRSRQPDRYGKITPMERSDYWTGVIAGPAVLEQLAATVETQIAQQPAMNEAAAPVDSERLPLSPAQRFAAAEDEQGRALYAEAENALSALPGLFDLPANLQQSDRTSARRR